jgi:hypothetical protein
MVCAGIVVDNSGNEMKVKTKLLRKLCSLKENDLIDHLLKVKPNLKDYGTYLYSENENNKVLAVAHMDVASSVNQNLMLRVIKERDTTILMHPALDDRLGIFAILYLFPQYGIHTDILLVTDEEICASSAEDFAYECEKQYNWIVELDRAGEDVVMYEYRRNSQLVEDLVSSDFKLGLGSYSDICAMVSLEVSAFNMGIGYHHQHTDQCCAVLDQLGRQMGRLKEFYDDFKDKPYKHVYSPDQMILYRTLAMEFGEEGKWLTEQEWEELYGEEGSGAYWQGGQMHWSHVAQKHSSYERYEGNRLWPGEWDDSNQN